MRYLHFSLTAVIVLTPLIAVADEPKPAGPKSPAATAAIAKRDKALAAAEQAYHQAKQKANQELVAELKKALADVMKAGGPAALAEGNAIQKVIDSAGQPRLTKDVPAGAPWVVFTEVKRGDTITVICEGRWDAATNVPGQYVVDVYGEFPGNKWYGPLARIGDQIVRIPKRTTFRAAQDGTLSIRLEGGGVDNDGGKVTATVIVQAAG